jgi:hypothetical protein
MDAHPSFETFEQFWPFYVARHSSPATRWLHLGGFAAGLVVAGAGLRKRRSLPSVVLLPAIQYAAAAASHRFVEHNEVFSPGTPPALEARLWHVRADARMWTMMLTGRDAELQLLADRWIAENGSDFPAGRRRTAFPADERV